VSAAEPTPLEAVPPWPGLPPLFLKREDLLPHGGGAKVRRFRAHLEAGAAEDRRPLVVLSERGAHTFLTLARMQRDGVLRRPLVFLERAAARTPYAERNRAEILAGPDVRLITGPLPWLLLRLAWLRRRPAKFEVLGLGGQTPGGVAAAGEAYREARAQLAALGPCAGRTWHLVAAASGTLAEGLLRGIQERGAVGETLLVVPTGPPMVRRRLRHRLRSEPLVTVLPTPSPAWRSALAAARAFREHSGVWLDPRHALRAWLAACSPPLARTVPQDRFVVWTTGPHIGDPGPGAPAA
jgi:hypothetical protein